MTPTTVPTHPAHFASEGLRWSMLEQYLSQHIGVKFTHGFCPDCYEDHVRPDVEGRG
jgi:hypothetical protein